MKPSSPSKILMIGNDTPLTYLVARYADRSGYAIATLQTVPSAEEVCKQQPVALLFPSIERLDAAQSLIAELSQCDIPILVCSSVADEARARELGADGCLLHPLTYNAFLAALAATKAPGAKRR
jgi:DNA-binding response OmpR family regulator